MTARERAERRRRLVLGVLVGGPEHTAAIAARVRGQFYDVYGVLDELRSEKVVERDGCFWRLKRPRDERAGGNVAAHTSPIGTRPADLEPVHNPVDKSPAPVHNPEAA